jgi:glycosyl transferase family 25
MHNQLRTLGLQHEFFPAVDGRKLTQSQLEEMCNMEVVRAWRELLTPGMIGCSLSHYHLYRKMEDEGIQIACILEDDTRLSPGVPQVLAGVQQAYKQGTIDQGEVILLYYQSQYPVVFSKRSRIEIGSGAAAYRPVEIWRPITTAAYIITLSSARRLARLVYPVRLSPDSWAVYHREGAISGLRCVLPLPVQSGFFRSDVGYEQHKPINRAVKKMEQWRVFPVPQLLQMRRRLLARRQNRFFITDAEPNWKPNVF